MHALSHQYSIFRKKNLLFWLNGVFKLMYYCGVQVKIRLHDMDIKFYISSTWTGNFLTAVCLRGAVSCLKKSHLKLRRLSRFSEHLTCWLSFIFKPQFGVWTACIILCDNIMLLCLKPYLGMIAIQIVHVVKAFNLKGTFNTVAFWKSGDFLNWAIGSWRGARVLVSLSWRRPPSTHTDDYRDERP